MTDKPLAAIALAMKSNQFAEMERLCRSHLLASPDDPHLLLYLAISMHRQKRLDAALKIYADLAQSQPLSSMHWRNYATALHEVGRLEDAEIAFKTALKHEPVEVETLLNYGLLQLSRERPLEARETLVRAYRMNPTSVQVILAFSRACHACGDWRTDKLIEDWRSWTSLSDDEQLALSRLLLSAGDAKSAQDVVEEAAERIPDAPGVLLQLAAIYERLNKLEKAETLIERVERARLKLDESMRQDLAHQRAALLMRRDQAQSARAVLLAAGPRDQTDFEHYFELAKTYDRLGNMDSAMDALKKGHSKQFGKIVSVAPEFGKQGSPVFSRTSVRISARDYAGWPHLVAPDADQSPIFVVGFPRSGTTLLEQMLDAHPKLQSMDERPFFHILADQLAEFGAHIPEDLGNLSQQDCDELRKGYFLLACSKVPRRWDAQLVDKNPMNMLWLPMIHRLYPEARFILALRHPCDVILSCYMQNFRSNVLASACANMEKLARGYVEAMEHWLHHVHIFNPNVLVSRYEDLVADPRTRLESIAEFLHLEDAGSMLDFDQRAIEKGFIATPSYTQVIEPVSSRAIGRWQRYRKYFEPVLPILQPMLKHWGYSADP